MQYSHRKPFVVRTQLDGTYLYLKEEPRHLNWWEDPFLNPQARTPSHFERCTTSFTQYEHEATRFTENKAKAAKKRAEKGYENIICKTEKGGRLHFEIVNLQNSERK